jgi:hypothetical protein
MEMDHRRRKAWHDEELLSKDECGANPHGDVSLCNSVTPFFLAEVEVAFTCMEDAVPLLMVAIARAVDIVIDIARIRIVDFSS